MVRTVTPKDGDRSRGNAHTPGEIHLNLFWFSAPPEMLIEAGEAEGAVPERALDGLVRHGGIPQPLLWHGGIPQPFQILVHEFGHVLIQRLGQPAEDLCRSMWIEATTNFALTPSGYALTDADEFGAELFVGVEAGNPQGCTTVDKFDTFLRSAV